MSKIFYKQGWHLLSLTGLIFALYAAVYYDDTIIAGELWGFSTKEWFVFAIVFPIIHQVYVLLAWRYELYYKSLTKALGKNAFAIYKAIFFVFLLGRVFVITFLAISNTGTLNIEPVISYSISGFIFIIVVFSMYSVMMYFGTDRAAGLDHFDKRVSKLPYVKKGIYKYTNNAMYLYAFLIIYLPGLLLFSKAALLIAVYSHIYIWVHYYFTEQPDMKVIYKTNS